MRNEQKTRGGQAGGGEGQSGEGEEGPRLSLQPSGAPEAYTQQLARVALLLVCDH